MVTWRKMLLVMFTLILGGGQVFAASSREDRAYAAAVAAFHDQIYSQAEAELEQFVEKFPGSSHAADAVLLKAQAQFKQGKYAEAISTLSTPPVDPGKLADQYAYWLGETRFAQGDYDHAAMIFINLAGQFPDSALGLTSVVEAATAYAKMEDWPQLERLLTQTNGVFVAKAAMDSQNELVSRGRLLLAQAQLAQKNYAGANATLKLLSSVTLPPSLDWQQNSLQCRVLLGAGNLEGALAVTTNLLDLARQQPDAALRLADSVALRGTVLERMGQWEDAEATWTNNLAPGTPVERQREAILKLAADATAQKNFTNAEVALGQYLLQFSNSPATDLALLTQGELNLRQYMIQPTATNHLLAALQNFDQLLTTNTAGTELIGRAHLDRGWCHWFETNYPASLADFQTAAERLPFSTDLAVAKFKVGDVLLAMTNYSGARTSYQAVLDEFGNLPAVKALGDRALYQIIRCSVELQDAAGAENAMHRLLQEYPKSDLADNGMLLLGEGLAEFGPSTNAVEVFHEFAKRFPDSPLTPQVKLELARTYEHGGGWPTAIASYENWLKEYPTNQLQPQVEYALAWAQYQSGNETNALARFTNFVSQHPADPLAPQAQWWVADYYFRLGNYSEAEKNYEYIFQSTNAVWKKSDLFYPAQLMAGRAAIGRQGYPDAAHYLTAMAADTNCPPETARKALFAYGGVLMIWASSDTNQPLANFQLATNVFSQLCAANPTNEFGALAWSELGDCNFQLGVYGAATNDYAQAVNSPYAGIGLRCRAQVGLGRVLEKMAETAPPKERKTLLEQALGNYFQVFQTNLGKSLNDNESPEVFWVQKAGLQMLPLMVTLKEGDLDYFFDRMERLLPQMKESLEKKKAALEAEKN